MKLKKYLVATMAVLALTGCGSPTEKFEADINAGNYEKATEIVKKYAGDEKYDKELAGVIRNRAVQVCERVCNAQSEGGIVEADGELGKLYGFNLMCNTGVDNEAVNSYLKQFELLYGDTTEDELIAKRLEVFSKYFNKEPEEGFFEKNLDRVLEDTASGKMTQEKAVQVCTALKKFTGDNLEFITAKADSIYNGYNKGEVTKAGADMAFNVLSNGIGGDAVKVKYDEYNALVTSKESFQAGVTAMNNKDLLTAFSSFQKVVESDSNYPQVSPKVEEMKKQAVDVATGQVDKLCQEKKYDDAYKVLLSYSPYIDKSVSNSLSRKIEMSKLMDKARENYSQTPPPENTTYISKEEMKKLLEGARKENGRVILSNGKSVPESVYESMKKSAEQNTGDSQLSSIIFK